MPLIYTMVIVSLFCVFQQLTFSLYVGPDFVFTHVSVRLPEVSDSCARSKTAGMWKHLILNYLCPFIHHVANSDVVIWSRLYDFVPDVMAPIPTCVGESVMAGFIQAAKEMTLERRIDLLLRMQIFRDSQINDHGSLFYAALKKNNRAALLKSSPSCLQPNLRCLSDQSQLLHCEKTCRELQCNLCILESVSALADRRSIFPVSACRCARQLTAAAIAPRKATAVTYFVLTVIAKKWWEV